jgi:hypothetical protein
MDPYGFGYEGEGNSGRVWWVYDDGGPSVTAWDFLEAHPDLDWDAIEAREVEWQWTQAADYGTRTKVGGAVE